MPVLGAVAQLERALIAERTKAGLLAAANAAASAAIPACARAIRRPSAKSRRSATPPGSMASWRSSTLAADRAADAPGPALGRCRRVLNQRPGTVWTVERLRRTVRRLAAEGIVEASLLDRAPPQGGTDRLIRLVAGIKTASPDWTLQQIASQLEAMRERHAAG